MLTQKQTFNPKEIRFIKDDQEKLFIENGYTTEGPIKIKQPFPLSNPNSYLVIENEEGEFVGLIKGYSSLDAESRTIINEQLDYSYFIPKIQKINEITEKFGFLFWDVETDRGPRKFEVRSRKRDIRWLSDTHIIIKDADGNKYEVPDLHVLDEESINQIEMEV